MTLRHHLDPTHDGGNMALGPVDIVIIGFPGNKFSGEIVPALQELIENRTVRVLDLLFVIKDAEGTVAVIEAADLDPVDGAGFLEIDIVQPGALNEEDADEVSEDLPLNSSALLIAFENTWAGRFVEAVFNADGVVIDNIRIPATVVNEVISAE
jgi:hypothetical protein